MRIICVLILLLTGIFPMYAVESESKQAGWTVYVENGNSLRKQVELLPASTPLDNYRENLLRIAPEMVAADEAEEDAGDGPFPQQVRTLTHPYAVESLTVAALGTWYDYEVFDVENPDARHRSIVLRNPKGNHRILYTQSMYSTISQATPPRFVDIDGRQLLAYKAHPGGTGNFYIEYYFLFDEDTRLPVPLNLDVINQRLATLLPEGRAVWKGGGFDIESLTYSSPVWQEGDGNCCPSAGRVTMQLNMEENELVVTDAQYDPDANGPRPK